MGQFFSLSFGLPTFLRIRSPSVLFLPFIGSGGLIERSWAANDSHLLPINSFTVMRVVLVHLYLDSFCNGIENRMRISYGEFEGVALKIAEPTL